MSLVYFFIMSSHDSYMARLPISVYSSDVRGIMDSWSIQLFIKGASAVINTMLIQVW